MGICRVAAEEIERYMPCRMLTLGAQDRIETVDLKGGSVDAVDVKAHKGVEKIADLNYPQELGQYDLVVDCGTVEHCPNVFQAVKNAANAVKPGGRILHHAPVAMLNHGYFNLCPVFFRDYYELNGWTLERVDITDKNDEVIECGDRFAQLDPQVSTAVLVVAQRQEGATTERMPLQREYR